MTTRPIALLAVLVLSAAAFAVDTTPATTSAPATAPASSSGPVSVKEIETLKAATGKEITVTGDISRVSPSPSGSLTFVNFKGVDRSGFSAIIKKENKEAVDKAFDGDVAGAIKGKTVELTGTILDYQGRPEIDIQKPSQIKIIAKPDAASQPAKN